MKRFLEKRLARLTAKRNALVQKSKDSEDVNELRNIQSEVDGLNEEIAEIQEEISASESDETRSTPPANAVLVNGGIAGKTVGSFEPRKRAVEDVFAGTEYRTAFKAYVQAGTPIPSDLVSRAGGDNGPTVTNDLGAIIPTTIMNEFIEGVSKVYGQIYSKVRKLNVQGGVKFPVSDLKANFKWITETTVSAAQKAGDIKDFVEFSYNIGEIRVSQTLLSSIVSLSLFESEITRIMIEAYVEAMDKGIFSGSGSGQMLGIFNDTRVTNVIELTEKEFSDWSAWRKKLFSVIPLSKRGQGEFVFPASTVESYLLTMKDSSGRPIFREAADLTVTDSGSSGKFFGRDVTLVEPDVIADFETASAGDIVGLFWIPSDYAINTNFAFGIKRYFDDDKNQWINKGLTVVDGKILDPTGCYIIKKKAAQG